MGKAEEVEETEALFTKHWDMQIRQTAANVSHLHYLHLVYHPPNAQTCKGTSSVTVMPLENFLQKCNMGYTLYPWISLLESTLETSYKPQT